MLIISVTGVEKMSEFIQVKTVLNSSSIIKDHDIRMSNSGAMVAGFLINKKTFK